MLTHTSLCLPSTPCFLCLGFEHLHVLQGLLPSSPLRTFSSFLAGAVSRPGFELWKAGLAGNLPWFLHGSSFTFTLSLSAFLWCMQSLHAEDSSRRAFAQSRVFANSCFFILPPSISDVPDPVPRAGDILVSVIDNRKN